VDVFAVSKAVLKRDYFVVVVPREDISSRFDGLVTDIAGYFGASDARTGYSIASCSSQVTAELITRALNKHPGKKLNGLRVLYFGESPYVAGVRSAVEAAGGRFYFRERAGACPDVRAPEAPADAAKDRPAWGLAGGRFTAQVPGDWDRQDDDATDPKSFLMSFTGPKAENVPVTITVEFFADGNRDFKDYTDFVQRNTWDGLENKQLAEPAKTMVNGLSSLWFEKEYRSFLHPESKSDESVMLKEKFYVFLGADRKGFFVLHYTAPSSVFDQYAGTFEKLAGSFQLL
jgi:hypothetical protein